ncbi:MAG: hypothetical protein RIQ60_2136 [Pseudomonadota bacterium]|jgi:SAM-dependent methyltransferase
MTVGASQFSRVLDGEGGCARGLPVLLTMCATHVVASMTGRCSRWRYHTRQSSMPTMIPDTHLDIGCGTRPRNPYQRAKLYGLDIRQLPSTPTCEFRSANLVLEPIPFSDGTLGSVSAFDFIEHVPRVLPVRDGQGTRFPFVELMNEIWRVLAVGGRFYALTPAFPSAAAFHDPTHVNLIGEETHEYFSEPRMEGRMYGFSGRFRAIRAEWVIFDHAVDALHEMTPTQRFRRWRWRRAGRLSHFLWELEKLPRDTSVSP